MGFIRTPMGKTNPEHQEMVHRSAELGYEYWSDAAAALLGDPTIRDRGITAAETGEFLRILRENT